MSTPFERLFDKVDLLNEILDEGPEGTDAEFLEVIKNAIVDVATAAQALTVNDVETEFTDEDEDEDEETQGDIIEAESVAL